MLGSILQLRLFYGVAYEHNIFVLQQIEDLRMMNETQQQEYSELLAKLNHTQV